MHYNCKDMNKENYFDKSHDRPLKADCKCISTKKGREVSESVRWVRSMISIVYISMTTMTPFQSSISAWVAPLRVMAHRSATQNSGGEGVGFSSLPVLRFEKI